MLFHLIMGMRKGLLYYIKYFWVKLRSKQYVFHADDVGASQESKYLELPILLANNENKFKYANK